MPDGAETLAQIIGINGGESQPFSFAEDHIWLVRLFWAEPHGVPIERGRLDQAVRDVHGAVVTDSRGIYDAAVSGESPQKGLRSSFTGMELEYACQAALRCGTVLRWVHGGAMLGDSLTKATAVARRTRWSGQARGREEL